MQAYLIAVCGLLGVCVGSIVDMVAARVPRGESVAHAPSHCEGCNGPLRRRDLIPVLSWALLRGRCRACGAAIGAQPPLVEIGTGSLFALLAWRIGFEAELAAYLVCGAGLVALSMIDLHTRRLPTKVFYPTAIATAILLGVAALIEQDASSARDAAIAAAVRFSVFFAINLAYPQGLGFGDVRLSWPLGLVLGWISPVLALFGLPRLPPRRPDRRRHRHRHA